MTDSRRVRIVIGVFGILVGIAGLLNILAERHARAERERMFARLATHSRQSRHDPSAVSWEGRTYRPGDRVRIGKWAGTFKPEDTGATTDVQADRGRVGVVVRGEKRQSTDFVRIDPSEPMQIVRVRWDAQQWKVFGDRSVELPEFEATIHVSHLEPDRQ